MRVSDFDFTLPQSLIATSPKKHKSEARLLHVCRDAISDRVVADLVELVKPGDLLIGNNTKVIPARLSGKTEKASFEITLHKQLDMGRWSTFLKPARKLHVGDTIVIADDFSAEVVYKNGGEVHLDFNEKSEEFFAKIERYGVMPLPPYIAKKRAPDKSDNENYQTIFAQRPGAVAAPTAGLHFSQELVAAITAKNASIDYVTLHVGGGTFLPIKVENTDDHIMHSEYGEISKSVADRINATKKNGGRIIAIGTTSLRILESCVNDKGQVFSYAGETDIFITPGYEFKVADCMMTNFHLPQSTLFMLICAFSGTKTMKQAYAHAIEKEYRFYSYGDACFLENGVKD